MPATIERCAEIEADLLRQQELELQHTRYLSMHKEPFYINGLRVFLVDTVLEVKRRWWERLFSLSPFKATKMIENPSVANGAIYTIGPNAYCSAKTYVSLMASIAQSRAERN